MKHYRILTILALLVLALVAAPLVDDGVALAKKSPRVEKAEKPATAPKSDKPTKASRQARVEKPAPDEGKNQAVRHKATRTAGKSRHARKAAVAAENEEGDLGACAVTGLTVKSAILYNANTGEVLYEQNPDFQIPPASLTKVLTLFLVFDAIRQGRLHPWDVVEVSERAATQGGSNMHLRRNEAVKVTDLIMGIAIASANDACMAMADYLEGGNADAFVALMNDTAKRLGMANSVFMNPNGLPADGQLTTARDMLRLASAYLEQFPKALTIHSMQFFTHNNRQRHNANSLLGRYEGVDGLKTGFVCASGYNIIATAKRGDTRLIAVVLGSRNPRVRERETVKLLDKGFKLVEAKRAAAAQHVAGAPASPVLPVATVSPPQPIQQQAR
jgi:D-alanyl-D-alanine carboxypeptidase (penicillin-binding protein 5/6)